MERRLTVHVIDGTLVDLGDPGPPCRCRPGRCPVLTARMEGMIGGMVDDGLDAAAQPRCPAYRVVTRDTPSGVMCPACGRHLPQP